VLVVPQVAYSQRRASSVRSVDFANFTYPALWTKKPFTLKNGQLEFVHDHCLTEYALKGVTYVDLTGDGKKDAVVEVTDFMACGSSYMTSYYYIYTIRNKRLRFLRKLSFDYVPKIGRRNPPSNNGMHPTTNSAAFIRET
jgi:hypothetical protein